MEETIRVLVVDDHPLLKKAISIVLSECENIEVVGECDDGEDAVVKASALSPDVVVMDLGLPKMSGFQATEAILKINPLVRVLIFSASNDHETITKAMEVGAVGFLTKATNEIDIIKAVQETYHGSRFFLC